MTTDTTDPINDPSLDQLFNEIRAAGEGPVPPIGESLSAVLAGAIPFSAARSARFKRPIVAGGIAVAVAASAYGVAAAGILPDSLQSAVAEVVNNYTPLTLPDPSASTEVKVTPVQRSQLGVDTEIDGVDGTAEVGGEPTDRGSTGNNGRSDDAQLPGNNGRNEDAKLPGDNGRNDTAPGQNKSDKPKADKIGAHIGTDLGTVDLETSIPGITLPGTNLSTNIGGIDLGANSGGGNGGGRGKH